MALEIGQMAQRLTVRQGPFKKPGLLKKGQRLPLVVIGRLCRNSGHVFEHAFEPMARAATLPPAESKQKGQTRSIRMEDFLSWGQFFT